MTLGASLGVVTQARTTSTRLPGKVLLRAAGRTMLDHHLDRLLRHDLPVVVATTTNNDDDPVASLATARGLRVWRGPEHDVLARFAGAVRALELDPVVRVTSDCPLIDSAVVLEAVAMFEQANDPWCYVSNGVRRSFPRGMDVEVFSAEALLAADAEATDLSHREHVTPYLWTNSSGRMSLQHLVREPDASRFRLTLDTSADLVLLRRLIEDYRAAELATDELVQLLEEHPELVALNADVAQKQL